MRLTYICELIYSGPTLYLSDEAMDTDTFQMYPDMGTDTCIFQKYLDTYTIEFNENASRYRFEYMKK